jgi:hypothetical protein
MPLTHHPDTEMQLGDPWAITFTLLGSDGQPLDLSEATLQWTLLGPNGQPVLTAADATITIDEPTSGGAIQFGLATSSPTQIRSSQHDCRADTNHQSAARAADEDGARQRREPDRLGEGGNRPVRKPRPANRGH